MHLYEIYLRKDKRGVDLISDVLSFGRLRTTLVYPIKRFSQPLAAPTFSRDVQQGNGRPPVEARSKFA